MDEIKKITEQIKDKVDKGISVISTSLSGEPQELAQIKSRLRRLRKQKETAIFEFGMLAYESFESDINNSTSIDEKFDEIKKIDDQINRLENEAERIQEIALKATDETTPFAHCECGAGLEEGQRFCGSCGKNVEQVVLEAIRKSKEQEPISCSNCQAKIPRQAKFCPKCGVSQKREEPEVKDEQPDVNESIVQKETEEIKGG